jgi:hypothetical protein
MPEIPIPVEYRAEVIQPILELLLSGESAALVGVGSSGKSNIARHLKRLDVRAHYLGAEDTRTLVVFLNCKSYAQAAPHDFYLYALDQLDRALEESKSYARVNDLWNDAQANSERLARRNLDRGFDRAVSAGIEHIICLMDDCDDLLSLGSSVLFTDLRELRDNHKNQLVFLTVTRREPAFLRRDGKEFEDFFELLDASGHTFPLPPYTPADGHHMLRRLAARQTPPRPVSEAEIRRLYEMGGGHAGLMRTMFFAARSGTDVLGQNILLKMSDNAEVEAECGKIMDSLEEAERDDLRRLAQVYPPTPDGLRRLMRRGLVHERVGRPPEIFSPVFEHYLQQEPVPEAQSEAPPRLQLEFLGGGQTRINGSPLALSRVEAILLQHLWANQPRPCPVPDLLTTMRAAEADELPEQRVHGPTLTRLNQYLIRLKEKLGPTLGQHLQTDGQAYWLVG